LRKLQQDVQLVKFLVNLIKNWMRLDFFKNMYIFGDPDWILYLNLFKSCIFSGNDQSRFQGTHVYFGVNMKNFIRVVKRLAWSAV
jgi:hypothetical protein